MEEGQPKEPPLGVHDDGKKLSVAVVCTAHSGHMNPVLPICSELFKRGHQIKVYTADYGKAEFEKKVKQTGSEIVLLDMQGHTADSITEQRKKENRMTFLVLEEIMLPALRIEFIKSKPDVVVADFAALAGATIAEEMDIPLVLNLPGPLSLLRTLCGMVDTSTAFNFLGLHVARQRLDAMVLGKWMNVQHQAAWAEKLRHHVGRGAVVLIQTIWGLDVTTPVYPNLVVTGPLLPPAADLRDRLKREHGELFKFLRDSPKGVVYVTTGSIVTLHDWQVSVLYTGLKKTEYRVVWSLKEEKQKSLPIKDDPNFFISKWTPQVELLQDPAVEAVITHCGWGGVLETLTAGKPIVAMPFFGEQPLNARLMQEYGVAELIGRIPTQMWRGGSNPYQEGWMTEETVASAVGKVMKKSFVQKSSTETDESFACFAVLWWVRSRSAAHWMRWTLWHFTPQTCKLCWFNGVKPNRRCGAWTGDRLSLCRCPHVSKAERQVVEC